MDHIGRVVEPVPQHTVSYKSRNGFEVPVWRETTKHFLFLEVLYKNCIVYLSTWAN